MPHRSSGEERPSIRRIGQLVRVLTLETQNHVEWAARSLGLNRSDVSALGEMVEAARQGRTLTPGDLGFRVHLSAAAMTALVDRLEKSGHATRSRHEVDRRRVVVRPTETGEHASRALFCRLNEAQREALAHHSEEELDLFATMLAEMVEATKSAGPGASSAGR